jgi:hypothetical protein
MCALEGSLDGAAELFLEAPRMAASTDALALLCGAAVQLAGGGHWLLVVRVRRKVGD